MLGLGTWLGRWGLRRVSKEIVSSGMRECVGWAYGDVGVPLG